MDRDPDNADSSRRDFLKGVTAIPLLSLFPNLSATASGSAVRNAQRADLTPKGKKFVAIQVGARSFVDEGVDKVLDDLQQKGGVNVLMPAVFTYGRGLAGRQVPGQPLPDHGGQEYDQVRGGSYAKLHAEFNAKAVIKDARAPELGDFDILADVIPKAKARGMQTYCLFEEAYNPRVMPGFEKIAEVDINGKAGGSTCLNNPFARDFLVALVEDWFRHNELDGMMWESERQGPLYNTLGAHFGRFNGSSSIYCFCQYCTSKAKDRGINVERTRTAYSSLARWVKQTFDQGAGSGTGAYVSLWRLMSQYPEVIAWHQFWLQ